MIGEKVFNDVFFKGIQNKLEESSYNPVVSKRNPESNVFPRVIAKLYQTSNRFTTLTYGEIRYPFRVEIDVYAIDVNQNGEKVAKRTVCNEITDLIESYFNENFKVFITRNDDTQNIDGNVQRNNMKISGVIDTKYGDELTNIIIYPQ